MISLRSSGKLNSANLCRRLDSDRIMGWTFGFRLFQVVYLDLHCMLAFSLDLDLMRFETWRRILDFRLFVWLCFICLESLGPKGEC